MRLPELGARPTCYRVWIVDCGAWRAASLADVPPSGLALEPAETEALSDHASAAYLVGFNTEALRAALPYWAVRVPVLNCFLEDLHAGDRVGQIA